MFALKRKRKKMKKLKEKKKRKKRKTRKTREKKVLYIAGPLDVYPLDEEELKWKC
jgi:hypothetical protein